MKHYRNKSNSEVRRWPAPYIAGKFYSWREFYFIDEILSRVKPGMSFLSEWDDEWYTIKSVDYFPTQSSRLNANNTRVYSNFYYNEIDIELTNGHTACSYLHQYYAIDRGYTSSGTPEFMMKLAEFNKAVGVRSDFMGLKWDEKKGWWHIPHFKDVFV